MKCIVNDDVVLSRRLEGRCRRQWLGQQAVSMRRVSSRHVAGYLRCRACLVQI